MRIAIILLGCILCLPICSRSQESFRSMQIGMDEAIRMAQGETPDKVLADTRMVNEYWRNRAFNGRFKPQLAIFGTIPDFNRSIEPITLPDGTEEFIERSLANNSVDLRLSQNIPGTGTNLYASSGFSTLIIFNEDSENDRSYLSNPISIGIEQPLFQYNQNKWDRKIQPLAYEEAKRRFREDLEQLAYEAVDFYFQVYNARLNLDAANLDKTNTDSLFALASGRFEVGRIAETDLLQIELTQKNAEALIAQSNLELNNATERLREHLGIREAIDFDLDAPRELPDIQVDRNLAMQEAYANRSRTLGFQRRMMQAESEVDRAQKQYGLNIDISGQFGLSQTSADLGGAYNNLLDQERLRIGIEVPITDWGFTKAERQIAATNMKLEQLNIEQETVDFERQIENQIDQFELLKKTYEIAKATYDVAQKKYDITQARYFVGNIGSLDLNNSFIEKESARRGMISALRDYWLSYYAIRGLTLYDFELNQSIYYELPVEEEN